MPLLTAERLTGLARTVLAGGGAPDDTARTVAGSLVLSNLLGHDSHGVRRVSEYLEEIDAGRIDPGATPGPGDGLGGIVTIKGRRSFGQLSVRLAVDEIVRRVGEHGVVAAVIDECNHVGRLGEYVADMARADLVGLAWSNADPTVAPFGGRERRLGTNPMAWAVPRGPDAVPVVVDWATAAVAEGKLADARDRGASVPPGALLDRLGRVSTDPADFYRGGALLPFGGHKGYGLSMVIELTGGLLSGTGLGSMPGYDGTFGTVLIGLDVAAFTSVTRFREQVEQFCRELSETQVAEGHNEVLVPGEPEERTRKYRTQHGIPVPEPTWRQLRGLVHLAS